MVWEGELGRNILMHVCLYVCIDIGSIHTYIHTYIGSMRAYQDFTEGLSAIQQREPISEQNAGGGPVGFFLLLFSKESD